MMIDCQAGLVGVVMGWSTGWGRGGRGVGGGGGGRGEWGLISAGDALADGMKAARQ